MKDTDINWDRIPHYVVGDKRFVNSIAAWQEITESKREFHFSLFDKSFGEYDWSTEPVEDIQELSRQRAQQLRDRYDWLRLWYSGGRDSHHILKTFLDNNIHIDEVVIYHNPFIPIRDWEMKTLVYPLACEMLKYTTTKISTFTLRESDFEFVFHKKWDDIDPLRPSNVMWYQPTNFGSRLFELRPEQFAVDRKLYDRVGVISGMEKPRLLLEDGNWYMQMSDHDGFLYASTARDNTELFYISSDLPALHAKQTWLALRRVESAYSDRSPEWIKSYISGTIDEQMYDDLCLSIGRGPYSHPFLGLGSNKLAPAQGRSHRFQKYLDHSRRENSHSYQGYTSMIEDLKSNMSHAFNHGDPMRGTMGILSKKYFLKRAELGENNGR